MSIREVNPPGNLAANVRVASMELSAVVIRKDGTTEDLGAIARYDRRWYMRIAWNCRKTLKRMFPWSLRSKTSA